MKKLSVKIPDYIHIHFPDYTKLKGGFSCSLGLFLILYTKILNLNLKNTYMAMGEVDIYGNVRVVGAIEKTLKLIHNTDFGIDIAFFLVNKKNSH